MNLIDAVVVKHVRIVENLAAPDRYRWTLELIYTAYGSQSNRIMCGPSKQFLLDAWPIGQPFLT